MSPSPLLHKQAIFLFILFLLNIIITNASAPTGNDSTTDRAALLAIKSKITHDPHGIMSSWNDSLHFCQWQGVTCGRRHKRVTVLDFESKGLGGSLSPYVGNMSFLRSIQLANNTLQGTIPPEVGRLSRLQFARFDYNSFGGEIPANLSQCSELKDLDLSYNNLVGRIPVELNSLSRLEALYIFQNSLLTGGIPTFIGNLTSLEYLVLTGCPLGGSIPDIFRRLRRLRELRLSTNQLVSNIPSSIYNLSLLEALDLSFNEIQDSLPANLGSMFHHLRILALGYNFITGSLPPSLSNCSHLSILSIGHNNLTRKITVDFGELQSLQKLFLPVNNLGGRGENGTTEFLVSLANCSNLELLEVGSTGLRGSLPTSLGNFSAKLTFLSLGLNNIYGSIPPSIGNLIGLRWLNIGCNWLTGTIPSSIGNLHNLQRLDLRWNDLSGEIPDTVGNLSSLLHLYIIRNRLAGPLPVSLGRCQKLISLGVRQNSLSGHIPKQLFELSSLSIFLDLRYNKFSGPIPSEVGNLKNLNQLAISGNNLSGELPGALGSCTSIVDLKLDNNSFEGSIPASLGSLKALQFLDLSSNNFSGSIPAFMENALIEYLNLSFNNLEGEVPMKGVFANASAVSVQGNHRLCGGIPEFRLPRCTSIYNKHSNGRRRKLFLALIVSISTLVGATLVSFILLYWCIKKRKDRTPRSSSSKEPLLKISYERLLKATNGFSSENLIGIGGFSSVYKGILEEVGLSTVAVKVLNLQHRGGSKSFVVECEVLRNVRHRNLVKVITSCSSIDFQGNDFRAIVYEFMPNGSLEGWLNPSTQTVNEQDQVLPTLGLLQRINIALDVAYAIDYLHHHCGKTIVHCDLKPSNILLDGDMVAHVGDFGLAKILLPKILNSTESSLSVGIRGTVGYTAPEYGLGSEVSTKGDVYSYGILLLEMITGKQPTDPMFQGGLTLHNYASTADSVLDIVDPVLLPDDNAEVVLPPDVSCSTKRIDKEACLVSLVKLAVACSMDSAQDRMSIGNVIEKLHSIKDTMADKHRDSVS